MRKRPPPTDHFGNLIEVGDKYFYGSPAWHGVVTKITGSSIVLVNVNLNSMKCKSPEKGVCLEKIPGLTAKTQYKVEWRMWKGTDSSGMSEYSNHSQLFDDKTEAYACFEAKLLSDDQVKLTKITTDQLEASDEH